MEQPASHASAVFLFECATGTMAVPSPRTMLPAYRTGASTGAELINDRTKRGATGLPGRWDKRADRIPVMGASAAAWHPYASRAPHGHSGYREAPATGPRGIAVTVANTTSSPGPTAGNVEIAGTPDVSVVNSPNVIAGGMR